MANTIIQIKRSLVTNTPPTLNIGEPAYSYSSNTLFIGSPASDGSIPIGGWDSYIRGISAYERVNTVLDSVNAASLRANNSLNANTGGVITGDITIQGNLSIIGGSIGANVPTVLIGDNIISLNTAINQSGQPTMNAGIEIDRGAQPNVYLLWNETDNKWTFTNDGVTYDDFGGSAASSYANSAFIKANSAFLHANYSFEHANSSFIHANSGFIQANYSFEHANSSFIHANSGFIQANSSFFHVNAAYLHANAAYTSQNTSGIRANSAFEQANAAFIHANSAFQFQNASGSYANSGFIQANSAYHHANAAFANANGAFAAANAAFANANGAFAKSNASYNHANSAFIQANASYNHANSAFIQANASFNTGNAAYIRANNSLNANVGGNVTGDVVIIGNLTSNTLTTTGSNGSITGANAIFSNYFFGANGTVDLYVYTSYAFANANGAFAKSNAAYNHANSAFIHANSAYLAGNGTAIAANTPSHVANSASIYANGAFVAANVADSKAVSSGSYANSSFVHANAAFDYSNSSYAHANAAYISQNATGQYANAAFVRANNSLNANVGGTIDGDVIITGNLIVQGTEFITQTDTLAIHDNMIYLNNPIAANVINAVGNGTHVIYTTEIVHGYDVGMGVTVSGVTPSSFDISGASNTLIGAVTSNTFTVVSTVTDTYVSGGVARARTSLNPDLGFAGGYYTTSYAHAGLFRDASDGIWKFFHNYTPEPDTSPYINTNDPSFRIADLTANIITDVISVRGIDPLQQANNAFDKANASFIHSNSSFNHANAAFNKANTGVNVFNQDLNTTNNVTFNEVTANNVYFDNLNLTGNIFNSTACSAINFVDNSSGDGYGGSTIEIVPDTNLTFNDRYLIVDPTAPNHIHIRAGGTQDSSQAELYIGGENSYFKVDDGANPNLYISSNGYLWTFDTDGTLTWPDGTTQNTSPYATSLYANAAFIHSNAAFDKANNADLNALSAGSYANSAFAAANNVTPQIQPAYDTANAAFIQANAAFDAANNASDPWVRGQANAAFIQANAAILHAQSAFNHANAGYDAANTADNKSIASGNYANAAFIVANATTIQANAAFDHANSGFVQANSAFFHANSGFIQANASYNQANASFIVANATSTQANAAFDIANASFIRANNSLNANLGGTVTANVVINANLQVANVSTNTYIQFGDGTKQYTANAGTGGGGGGANAAVESWTTIADGTSSTFTMSFAPTANAGVVVSIGGIVQSESFDYLLTPSNSTISFNEPPPSGQRIRVAGFANASPSYIDAANSAGATINTFEGIGDGANLTFNLGFDPVSGKAIFVSLGGILQPESAYIVNSSNNTIQFFSPPQLNENIRVVGYSRVNPYYVQYINSNVSVSIFETTANGNQSTFQLTFNPQARETLLVTIDGVVQPISAYTVDTSNYTISFLENPGNGELVRVSTFYTTANAFVVPDGSITLAKLAPDYNSYVISAFNQANSSFIQANSSFIQANSSFIQANAAFDQANTAATTGKAIAMSIVFGG